MDRAERARIFMPFSALKGYYDLILAQEQGREIKRELGDEAAEEISHKLAKINKGSSVKIRYYETGSYLIEKGEVSRIDYSYKYLILNDAKIWFEDIEEIEDYVPEGKDTWLM